MTKGQLKQINSHRSALTNLPLGVLGRWFFSDQTGAIWARSYQVERLNLGLGLRPKVRTNGCLNDCSAVVKARNAQVSTRPNILQRIRNDWGTHSFGLRFLDTRSPRQTSVQNVSPFTTGRRVQQPPAKYRCVCQRGRWLDKHRSISNLVCHKICGENSTITSRSLGLSEVAGRDKHRRIRTLYPKRGLDRHGAGGGFQGSVLQRPSAEFFGPRSGPAPASGPVCPPS